MKFCLYAEKLSPHLMPIVKEMVSVYGEGEVRYVYTGTCDLVQSGYELGWGAKDSSLVINKKENPSEADRWLHDCDILLCELRDLELWEYRAKSGKGMFYTSERWFKPKKAIRIFSWTIYLPGWVRLLHPGYFRMAVRACRLFNSHENLIYLANGFYAANDFVKLFEFTQGRILSLARKEVIDCDCRPGGKVWLRKGRGVSAGVMERVRIWGYFVAPSELKSRTDASMADNAKEIRCLWVGRLLDWKCVDTIVRAVVEHTRSLQANPQTPNVILDIYGSGPEEARLKKEADGFKANIRFHPPVGMMEVRGLMRQHDVYILSSNECEGWGAVVNEALEEGMVVLGTYEAGASRVMLPVSNLFHAGDHHHLRTLILTLKNKVKVGEWTSNNAARLLRERIKGGI